MILCVKTNEPEAYIALVDRDGSVIQDIAWQAHRQLGETLHRQLQILLEPHGGWDTVSGMVYFHGPGSFTGLRISAAVVNAAAVSIKVPVVSTGDERWIFDGTILLAQGVKTGAVPFYGEPAKTTLQKK